MLNATPRMNVVCGWSVFPHPTTAAQKPFTLERVLRGAGATAETHNPGGGNNLVFLEPSLLLRSYNSVSLAEDGTYSLTISDCHGFIPTSASAYSLAGERPLVPVPNGDQLGKPSGDTGPVEKARLLFLSLPSSIEFDVDGRKVGNPGRWNRPGVAARRFDCVGKPRMDAIVLLLPFQEHSMTHATALLYEDSDPRVPCVCGSLPCA